MSNESFVDPARHEFGRLKQLADRAMEQVDDNNFFAAPGMADNSIAIIVKHIAGNMRSRWRDFLSSDGEKPDRMRDREFVVTSDDTRSDLLDHWEGGWSLLFHTLDNLVEDDLRLTVTIRGEPHTVIEAIHRQLTHYAYHVGQIVFLARHFVGERWKTLSVPKGQSEEFDRNPRRYFEKQ